MGLWLFTRVKCVYMDPAILPLVVLAIAIVVVGLVLKRLRQPHVVGYILAGVLIGPFGLAVVTDYASMARVGAFGVLLLVFFIGMELPLRSLITHWRAPILGTALEIMVSVVCVWPLGAALGWTPKRIVFLGFVISMSSTAVILNILRDRGELNEPIGRDVTGITVAQDLAVIPMLVVLGLLSGDRPHGFELTLQSLGGLGALAVVYYIARCGGEINLPFASVVRQDREIQIFAAFFVCFGFALLTGLMHLSAALGAFLAGVVLAAAKHGDWVREHMDPFRVVFVALFFVSVGMLIDLQFLRDNVATIAVLVAVVFVVNTFINAVALRAVGHPWRASVYGGALLSQIGEFSFVLAAVGLQNGIITEYAYQTTIAVICLSLLLSPAWISLFRRLVYEKPSDRAGKPASVTAIRPPV